jgi:plasmid stabilization system protein ParE
MRRRYVLSPEALNDLVEIWRYVRREGSRESADRVKRTIQQKIEQIAASPGIGHRRPDVASDAFLFSPVYSYLIVYRIGTKPLQVVAIIHGMRDLPNVLAPRQ